MSDHIKTRAELVGRAKILRGSIQQLFDDAAHWNRVHVPWKGAPIDPDPDGKLASIAAGIDRMLEKESARGVKTLARKYEGADTATVTYDDNGQPRLRVPPSEWS